MYLHIDSRNRSSEFPNANTFVLTLQDPIKNISRACVTHAKIGSGSPIGSERYIFLDIVELRSDQMIDVPFISSEYFESHNINKFIGIIPNNGDYYKPSNELWAEYSTPLDSLYKLSIRLTDYKGVPIDLDSEEFTFILQIDTRDPEPVSEAPEVTPEALEAQEAREAVPLIKRIPVPLLVFLGFLAIFIVINFRPFRSHHTPRTAS